MLRSPYNQESYFDNLPESLSLDKWQITINLITKLFDAPAAWIMQANNKGMEALVASTEKVNNCPAGSTFDKEEAIYCKKILESKQKLYVKNAEREGGWDDNPEYAQEGFISYLGVPLQWPNGAMFGTLCVLDKRETNYSIDFIALMWQLKELIDADLQNMVLIKKLKEQSTIDELTEIFNRRGFIKAADSLISHAIRNEDSLSLMYFDINNLKIVNDTHGHKAGDFLIQSFANAISDSIRQEDIIARIGGDEFCFMGIYQSDFTDKEITLRIQKTLELLTLDDNRIENPSFSTGYKVFKSSTEFNIDKMLSETDSLMYENKEMMKNRSSKRE